MHCDERKQICLNYAGNVPEWQLGLTLDALANIADAVSTLGKVQKAVAGDLAWIKNNPDSIYMGTIPIDRERACKAASDALGKAMYALEIVSMQSYPFSGTKDLATNAEVTYNTQHAALEDRCRRHGCPEVAYRHG
nr:MAG TPA: hypothetical protein [Caudoviricetes sp.]